jgi:hypothetical protein
MKWIIYICLVGGQWGPCEKGPPDVTLTFKSLETCVRYSRYHWPEPEAIFCIGQP